MSCMDQAPRTLIMVGMSAMTYLKGNSVIQESRVCDDDDGIAQENRRAQGNEADIYILLDNKHPYIAVCKYISPAKDHVELEYYPHSTLRDYVNNHRNKVTDRALSKGVRHSDLGLDQWLLHDMDARLADFNGSGYDAYPSLGLEGSGNSSLERLSHFMPRDPSVNINVGSGLFALGSVLYELVVGENPYEGLEDDVIEELFERGEFPDVEGLLLGSIITRCWKRQFVSAD